MDGWIAALLDASMSAAVAVRLSGKQLCTTIEIKINYVKAVMATGGTLRSFGEILHEGKRIIIVKGVLINKENNIVAYTNTSCLIID